MDTPAFAPTFSHPPPAEPGAPSWPVALLFPPQGQWTESEYWIVNPKSETVVVLTLDGAAYRLHGEFPLGTTATSVLLPALIVDVTAVFDAGRGTQSENG